MIKLIKTNNDTFKEFYTATKGNKTVNCILDTNCVRFCIIVNGRLISKKEFFNTQKEYCFRIATEQLNK